MTTNAKSIEGRIRRLEREIAEIDQYFYGSNKRPDRHLYAGMLERKRDDMVRSAVLQLHTAIEDLLDYLITCRILEANAEDRAKRMSSKAGRALRKMLYGAGSLGFDMKLNFAVSLRLVQTKVKERLMELNTLRNKCSHNWVLKVSVRRGRRPQQKKPPLLLYEGRDLHNIVVLKEFIGEYATIYVKLFGKHCDLQPIVPKTLTPGSGAAH